MNKIGLLFNYLLIFIFCCFCNNIYSQCLPGTDGNGPSPCDAKLYCSNSAAVDNGNIACTSSADTDGSGLEVVHILPPSAEDDAIFSSILPDDCYADLNPSILSVQWTKFYTPVGVNEIKIQGVGTSIESWAVFFLPDGDGAIGQDCTNGGPSLSDLTFIGSCREVSNFQTVINEDADLTEKGLYYIAFFYIPVGGGSSINFKVKECAAACAFDITCPSPGVFDCDNTTAIDNFLDNASIVFDACSEVGTIVSNDFDNADFNGCGGAGNELITFTLESSSNVVLTSCTVNLTINEPGLPEIDCPTQAAILCTEVGTFIPMDGTFTGDCGLMGSVSGTVTMNNSTECGGSLTVTYTGDDTCGRALTAKECIVNVSAANLPEIDCPTQAAILCTEVGTFIPMDGTFTGDCGLMGSVSGTVTMNNSTECGGSLTVTYTGDDTCGRALTAKECIVNVSAANLPEIDCPTQAAILCTEVGTFIPMDGTFTGDCGLMGSVSGTVTMNNSTECGGSLTVTYTGDDTCGRTLTAKECIVNVSAANLPEIDCPTQAAILCAEVGTFIPMDGTFTGDCGLMGSVSGTVTMNNSTECGGSLTVTYTGDDTCGRALTAKECIVNVSAANLPEIDCPTQAAILCTEVGTFIPMDGTFTGDCGLMGSVSGTVTMNNSTECGGSLTVTYTGDDTCGRALTAKECIVNVSAANLPEIDCPTQAAIGSSMVESFVPMDATFSSDCGLIGTATGVVDASGFDGCSGFINVTYSADDSCGRPLVPVTCMVEVVDDEAAEIICRQPISTTTAPGLCERPDVVVLPPYILSDNCGTTQEFTITRTPDINDFPIGTTVLTWTVTDASGNSTTCESLVIIQDLEPPTVGSCTTVIDFLEPGSCMAQVIVSVEGIDNCGEPTVEGTGIFTLPLGVHPRTITITDESGNVTIHEVVIFVHDAQAPEIVMCPEDVEIYVNDVNSVVDLPEPIFSDNCEITSVINDAPEVFVDGVTTVTFTATDTYGNTTDCSYDVNIISELVFEDIIERIEASTPIDETSSMVNWNGMQANTLCEACETTDYPEYIFLGDFNGHQYFLYNGAVSWSDAADLSEEIDGHLVTVNDERENEFLEHQLPNFLTAGNELSFWTGLSNSNVNIEWQNGDAFEYINFPYDLVIQPDVINAAVLNEDGTWTMTTGNNENSFIVERPCINFTQTGPIVEELSADGEITTTLLTPNTEWNIGEYVVTYQADDMCGNTATYSFDVAVDEANADYCNIGSINHDVWMHEVSINNYFSETGNNEGYADFTDEAISLEANYPITVEMYPFGLEITPTGKPLYMRIWADLNNDGDFFDNNEMVFEAASHNGAIAEFPYPTITEDTEIRIRVAVAEFQYPEVCADFTQGETEDYLLFLPFVEETRGTRRVAIFPNPADEYVMADLRDYEGLDVTIRILDRFGRVRKTENVGAAGENYDIDLSQFIDGMYFLEVRAEGRRTVTEKLVVGRFYGWRSIK